MTAVSSSSLISDLPPGWTEHKIPTSGRIYYYHTETSTTTYDRPSMPSKEAEYGDDDDDDDDISISEDMVDLELLSSQYDNNKKQRQPSLFASSTGSVSTGANSQVSFGSVRVHTHRMTLGDHPDTRVGPPVELEWDVMASETFENVEEFEKNASSSQGSSSSAPTTSNHRRRQVPKISAKRREQIASERHSRNSIVEVEEESRWIRKMREESENDHNRRRSSSFLGGRGKSRSKSPKSGRGGLLRGVFGRRKSH